MQNTPIINALNKDGIKNPDLNSVNNYITQLTNSIKSSDIGNVVKANELIGNLMYSNLNLILSGLLTNHNTSAMDEWYNCFASFENHRNFTNTDLRHGRVIGAQYGFYNTNYNTDKINSQFNGLKNNVDTNCYLTKNFKDFNYLCYNNKLDSLKCVSNMYNCTAVIEDIKKITENFNICFKRKVFLHWYTCEGMDEMEFLEASSVLDDVCSKYQQICDEE